MMLIPWICEENREASWEAINDTDADYCMGHFELNGFDPIPGYTMTHGDDPTPFKNLKIRYALDTIMSRAPRQTSVT